MRLFFQSVLLFIRYTIYSCVTTVHWAYDGLVRSHDSRRWTRARWLRLFLVEVGPMACKLGQILSVREDLFDPDMIAELQTFQQEAHSKHHERDLNVAAAQLRRWLDEIWQLTPLEIEQVLTEDTAVLGVGTIAVVYSVKVDQLLKQHQKVPHRVRYLKDWLSTHPSETHQSRLAIKVFKPDIETLALENLEDLLTVARTVESLVGVLNHTLQALDLKKRIESVRTVFLAQCSCEQEMHNLQKFEREYAFMSKYLVVPYAFPQFSQTQQGLLVMSYESSSPVSETCATLNMTQRQRVSRQFAKFVLSSTVMHGLSHADLHPGNLGLRLRYEHQDSDDNNEGQRQQLSQVQFVLYDFGMVVDFTQDEDNFEVLQDYGEALLNNNWQKAVDICVKYQLEGLDDRQCQHEYQFRCELFDIIASIYGQHRGDRTNQTSKVLKDVSHLLHRYQLRFNDYFAALEICNACVEGTCAIIDPDIQLMKLVESIYQELKNDNNRTDSNLPSVSLEEQKQHAMQAWAKELGMDAEI